MFFSQRWQDFFFFPIILEFRDIWENSKFNDLRQLMPIIWNFRDPPFPLWNSARNGRTFGGGCVMPSAWLGAAVSASFGPSSCVELASLQPISSLMIRRITSILTDDFQTALIIRALFGSRDYLALETKKRIDD